MILLFILSSTNSAETRAERTASHQVLQQTNPMGCIKRTQLTQRTLFLEDEVQSRKLSDMCVLRVGWRGVGVGNGLTFVILD